MVIFTGDIRDPGQRQKLDAVGQGIDKENSFLRRFTPSDAPYDTVFEILAVHSAPRTEVSIFDFPEVFRHFHEIDGYDYWKIYVDDVSYHEGHGKIYETFDVSSSGCAVVIRPDQYISYIGAMDDVDSLNEFFGGFMVSRVSSELNGGDGVNIKAGGHALKEANVVDGIEAKAADMRAF